MSTEFCQQQSLTFCKHRKGKNALPTIPLPVSAQIEKKLNKSTNKNIATLENKICSQFLLQEILQNITEWMQTEYINPNNDKIQIRMPLRGNRI